MENNLIKYLIVTTIALSMYAQACPTCVGRIRLGEKKPFFKLYRPHSRSRYAKKRNLLKEALSYKKTETSLQPSESSNLQKGNGK